MLGENPTIRSAAELAVEFHAAVTDPIFRATLLRIAGVNSLADLMAVTTLTVSALDIGDVAGIEYARSLTYLHCGNNDLAGELPVSELVNLTYLRPQSNALGLVDISLLVNLTQYIAHSNQFVDCNVTISHVNLILFDVYGNDIEQAELEDIIDTLHAIKTQLGANSCTIQLQLNPGSVAASSSQSVKLGELVAAGCSVTI